MTDRISAAYAAIAERPEAFITVRDEAAVRHEFGQAQGPLAGQLLAVKDNVDVAGLPTTAACPGYAYTPEADAPVVAALRAAGAVVIGKTNLDQFATGLVGTRSPYGAVRDARRPDRISGGSSSGSAVAVATGAADIGIATDTAGSGRVPAAYQGLVGIKGTIGLVSTTGVVPACPSYDCVTILARDLATAENAMAIMATTTQRPWPASTRFAAPAAPVLAVPTELPAMAPGWDVAFGRAVDAAQAAGMRIVPIDLTDFLAAARLLYDGALVAERTEAVGDFIAGAVERNDLDAGLDPTVAAIITAGGAHTASGLLRDRRELDRLRDRAFRTLGECDALLVPTAPLHPTLAEVAADPVGVNARIGTYTNFCNLFDMCGVAVPAGEVAESDGTTAQFGVTVLGRAFDDAVVADIAARLSGGERGVVSSWPERAGAGAVTLVVAGAHLRDQPLAGQLHDLGARWEGPARTAERYRMTALPSGKPALVRLPRGGRAFEVERWSLSPAALGKFLVALPTPMGLAAVELDDGSWETGFVCADEEAIAAPDISEFGGWRAYLRAREFATP
ncbi:allophanate hydrolase [Mycolicibacterium sp. CBMA 226]|uniref:allophanate hydrolase n=1 Tax=Mycolicibacterium sp. CBMA 226 TaxID=2606611 RepID=UPI0012DE185E|nr:allophanate hydrolase [Mycolicibacterium sp. CBMA 226]MUL74752.1 allophanate hydrolase [Mycolicibacterium sp. CBMA 226]